MLTVPQRYGQADSRQTDGRTTYDNNTALALLHRVVKTLGEKKIVYK